MNRPTDDPVARVDELERLARDPNRRRREAAALLLATLLTAAIAFSARRATPAPPAEAPPPVNVVLERAPPTPRPTPRPTAPPTPRPTPRPLVRVTPAPVPQRAAPRATRPPGGSRPALSPPLRPRRVAVRPPATTGVGAEPAPGSGNGPGAGAGNGADASGGGGTAGSGNGTADTAVPCGYVEFIPDEPPDFRDGNSYEHIRATVHFSDGHTESAHFPYPWVYADPAETDPWSAENAGSTQPVRAQLPPPGSDVSRFPPVIQYLLDHTNANGTTVLQECPDR